MKLKMSDFKAKNDNNLLIKFDVLDTFSKRIIASASSVTRNWNETLFPNVPNIS